MEAIVVVITL